MSILLRSVERYDRLAELDRESGNLREFFVPFKQAGALRSVGHYRHPGDALLAMYVDDGRSWLRVGDAEAPLESLHAKTEADNDRRLVTIYRDNAPFAQLAYPSSKADGRSVKGLGVLRPASADEPIRDTTPFAENEDFDFGLYIANVINDRHRQETMVNHVLSNHLDDEPSPEMSRWKVWLLSLLARRGRTASSSRVAVDERTPETARNRPRRGSSTL